MKTEVEILQALKDYAKGKNLSVSEKTLQHRAATLAKLNIEDDALCNTLMEGEQLYLEEVNNNIRYERSLQKRETEVEVEKKFKAKPSGDMPDSKENSKENPLLDQLTKLTNMVTALESKEVIAGKKRAIESLLLTKGVAQKDTEVISDLLGMQNITPETNEEEVSTAILNIYNKMKKPHVSTLPEKPSGDKLINMIEGAATQVNEILKSKI